MTLLLGATCLFYLRRVHGAIALRLAGQLRRAAGPVPGRRRPYAGAVPSQAFAPMRPARRPAPPTSPACWPACARSRRCSTPCPAWCSSSGRARPLRPGQPHPGTPLRRRTRPNCSACADEVFPSSLGPLYAEQDRRVLRGGATLENQLELHLYPGRQPGWCLTHKQALRDADRAIIGMAGISRPAGGAVGAPGLRAAGGGGCAYPRALRPAAQPRRSHCHRRALGGATGTSLQAHLPAHPGR